MKRLNPVFGMLVLAVVTTICGVFGFLSVRSVKKQYAEAEMFMPESAISTYFRKLNNGDYKGIYNDSMNVEPHMISESTYVDKLKEVYGNVKTDEIQYVGTDNGDGSMRYDLYYANKPLATLKLNKNEEGYWLASTIFTGDNTYTIEAPAGCSLVVNGAVLGDEYIIDHNVVASNFSGLRDTSNAPKVDIYYLENQLSEPQISVEGDSSYDVLKDVLTGHLFLGRVSNDASLEPTMIDSAITCAKYPARDTSLNSVAAISVTNSDWYSRISGVQNAWFTAHNVSRFTNESAFNIIQQSDNSFVGYVTFDYYASNGEVERTWHGGYQMTFIKEDGTWKIAGMAICNELNPLAEIPLYNKN